MSRGVESMLSEEPIYSLRSPGGAGKCEGDFCSLTQGFALGYHLSPLRGFEVDCGKRILFRSFKIALLAALMIESAGGQTLAPLPQQPSQADTNRNVQPVLVDIRVITEATISDFVSKIDTAVMKADVDAYATMLADEFTVTITSDVDPSQLPLHQSKSDYVRGMREGIKGCRVLAAKTTIDNTIITDPHAHAVVYCTLVERNQMSRKRTCDVTVHQKFDVELRKEGLKITKLDFQIAEAKWE